MTDLQVTPQDILAAIGFDASMIASVVNQHAMGAPFPSPTDIVAVCERMLSKAKSLEIAAGMARSANVNGALKVQCELQKN